MRIQDSADQQSAAGMQLERNRLLAALSHDASALLDPHLTDVMLARGTVLLEQGDPVGNVYFIHSGMVCLLAAMPDGQAVEVAAVGREGAIGAGVGIGWQLAPHRAVVQVSGRAARIAAPRLVEALQRSPALARMVGGCCESLMVQIQQIAACNALHGAEARLCRWLLHAGQCCGPALAITQETLSHLLGVQRTTINMLCRNLQSEGLIRLGRGSIEIRDRNRLEAKACGCHVVASASAERTVRELRETSINGPAALAEAQADA
jgi:CRP-like cAMP-binding protein